MHRYEPATPRVTLGLTSVVMVALTFGVFVVLPARMEAADDSTTLAVASPAAGFARIDEKAEQDDSPICAASPEASVASTPPSANAFKQRAKRGVNLGSLTTVGDDRRGKDARRVLPLELDDFGAVTRR